MQGVVLLHRRDGLEGLFAAFGIWEELSELQIGLKATGRFINGSIPQVSYSIFQLFCSIS
jgi:hypothetical protein